MNIRIWYESKMKERGFRSDNPFPFFMECFERKYSHRPADTSPIIRAANTFRQYLIFPPYVWWCFHQDTMPNMPAHAIPN